MHNDTNDITGDRLVSKPNNAKFRANFDKIFRNKSKEAKKPKLDTSGESRQ